MSIFFDSAHHSTFLGISIVTVIQFISTATIGGSLGIGLGELIYTYSAVRRSVVSFLRVGMWIPVFLLWFIPVVRDPTVWFNEILPGILVITTSAVTVATLRDYMIERSLVSDRSDAIRFAARSALMQALMVWLFSQPMMSGAGWYWYYGRLRALASMILVGTILFIIEQMSRSNFEVSSSVYARISLEDLRQNASRRIIGAGAVCLVLLFIWQLVANTPLYAFVSSPVKVLATLLQLLANEETWQGMYTSSIEIIVGVLIGVGIASLFGSILERLPRLRAILLPCLPMTFITPLITLTILSAWFFQQGLWPKIVGIALLSFFPLIRTLWGLRDRPFGPRLLMGVEQALPFAFVAMLFGESMAATKGFGFSLVMASALNRDRSEGLAIVFLIIALLAVYSWALRSIVRYKCLN